MGHHSDSVYLKFICLYRVTFSQSEGVMGYGLSDVSEYLLSVLSDGDYDNYGRESD